MLLHWWQLANEFDYIGANNVYLNDETLKQMCSTTNNEIVMDFFEQLECIGMKFEP